MKKRSKVFASIALAGAMCLSVGSLAACSGNEKEVPGKSAYEIAVDNGFTGTEEEWLESLRIPTPTTVTEKSVSYSVNEDGKTVMTVTFTMSDGSTQSEEIILQKRVIEADLNGANVILTADEAKNKSNLAGINWRVNYDDGSDGVIAADKSQIIKVEPAEYSEDWDGTFEDGKEYRFTLCFAKNWNKVSGYSCTAYICNDLSSIEEYKAIDSQTLEPYEPELDYDIYSLQVNDVYDIKTLSIAQGYELPSAGPYTRHIPVTESMLVAPIDTSTTGYKNISVKYNEKTYMSGLEVYDISVTTVEYLSLSGGDPEISITVGESITEQVEALIGSEAYVDYRIYTNGSRNETIKISESMIDTSDIDVNTSGNYALKINYKGYTKKIAVTVKPNMTGLEPTQVLSGQVLAFSSNGPTPIVQAKLYENGYAELLAPDYEDPQSYISLGYFKYTLDNGTLELKDGERKAAIFKVEETTLADYEFNAQDLVKTYSLVIDEAYPVKIYNNGFGVMEYMQMNVVFAYKIEGNTLTILTPMQDWECTINPDDTLTMNM